MRTAVLSILCCGWLAFAAGAQARTIAVNTTDDELNDGTDCSLREAVEAANTNAAVDECPAGDPGLDAIALPGGTYPIALGASGEEGNQEGDLDLVESLTISGAGDGTCGAAGVSCIDAADLDRAFDLRDGPAPVSVSLRDLTLEDGAVAAEGGAIRSNETDAHLALTGVTAISNKAGDGGAIAGAGALSVTDSLLAMNSATGGGGAIRQTGSALSVTDSVISADVSSGPAGGGGLLATSGATTALRRSTLSGNAAPGGPGGAARNQAGSALRVSQARVEGNVATSGGGISNVASLSVDQSTLDGNQAIGSCASGDGDGGAIDSRGATSAVGLVNSTVAMNLAGCAGGGLSVAGTPSTTTLTHLTVSANSAASGGGGVANDADLGGAAPIASRGTILSSNSVAGFVNNCGGDGARASAGANLETANSCGFGSGTGDLVGIDPLLGPLRYSGGPTPTESPSADSPAVNAVSSGCPGPPVDQRGVGRPVGGLCDIGAVELSPAPFCAGIPVTAAGTAGPDSLVGTEGRDVIASLGGNDVIQGLGDRDLVCGGAGNDIIVGGRGADRLRGEAGADKLFGGPGKDVLEGGAGKDKLKGGKGKDKTRQ